MWTANQTESVGFIAGLFTTCAALPQIVHAVRSRSMRDVSLAMILAMLAGLSLWLAYGVLLHSFSLIVWNAVTLGFYLLLLVLKLRLDAGHAAARNSLAAGRLAAGGFQRGANFVEDVER